MGFGDFNGDGRTDILSSRNGRWLVSWGARSRWEDIDRSSVGVDDVRLGDFNGDGKADILPTRVGKWLV